MCSFLAVYKTRVKTKREQIFSNFFYLVYFLPLWLCWNLIIKKCDYCSRVEIFFCVVKQRQKKTDFFFNLDVAGSLDIYSLDKFKKVDEGHMALDYGSVYNMHHTNQLGMFFKKNLPLFFCRENSKIWISFIWYLEIFAFLKET